MHFRLLGSTDVRSGDSHVVITSGLQRVLLAALLLRANRVVPVADLTDALWGATPPASAHASLQNYVKRLRHALGDDAHDRIQTIPPGYEIVVQRHELDVAVFERLLAAGRDAARAGAWPQAAIAVRNALAQWRGEALADLPQVGLVRQEAQRLADLRLLAVETRVTADLHLGQRAAIISELRQLTSWHPLRERLHGLLMLALWLDGQRAAAIMAYRQARGIVLRELGIEPGSELRDLHALMRGGDTSAAARAALGETPDLAQLLRDLTRADADLLRHA